MSAKGPPEDDSQLNEAGGVPEVKDRTLPDFPAPQADEVTEAAPPIERRTTPRTTARAFDRSKG
ncbi:MAG: hypothetical protein M3P00_08195, partial [Gemmatimonadota bacterium]|nr:hypothetical protein [Gemmatimonadota bacterium]